MQLRQVQAHEAPRRGLREVRRRGDPVQGAPRAHGHITLASPVAHIWFLKSLPSRIGNILEITLRDLEKVLYFEAYVVIDPKDTRSDVGELLNESELIAECASSTGATAFRLRASAPRPIREMLGRPRRRGGVQASCASMMREATSEAKRKKIAKRLKVLDAFRESDQPARVHDPRRHSGHSAGPAPARAARRRPLRDQRSERPVPPRDQPQQPAEAPCRS